MINLSIHFPGQKNILLETLVIFYLSVTFVLSPLCRILIHVHVFRQALNAASFLQVIFFIQWSVWLDDIFESSQQPRLGNVSDSPMW